MRKAELLTKFIELVRKYGYNGVLHTFNICSDYGVELAGSTIDKIEVSGSMVYFYFNENINDYDSFNMFLVRDLQKFYNGIKKRF